MSPELTEEIQFRVDTKLESLDDDRVEGEDDPTPEELELAAIEDIVNMEADYGGHFEAGLLPTFNGSPEWVAEMTRKQAESVADLERQHKAWLKMWREAKRELKRRLKRADGSVSHRS